MSHEFCQEIANDLEKLLTSEIGYDVNIYVGENENIKEFHAHSLILSTRSQYFCTAFSNEWAEKKDGKFIFKKPNVSPQFFEIILRFIYCGRIELNKLQGPEILKLLIVVDELNIQSLISHIQEYLIKHQDEFLNQNPIGILEVIYQHETFSKLWNYYLKKICEKPEMLFDSNKFINIKAPLLELLLKRDDLRLEEIVIWNYLLKWSFAQNPSISQDTTRWSDEEFTIMERTLHRFIPLIRFYLISSDDFLNKVYPLKKLLPEDLVDDLVKFHIEPNKLHVNNTRLIQDDYNSNLIKSNHFAIFSSWIEKYILYDVRNINISYGFNLLYRASRDGNTTAEFHAKCDNKGATIVVVKISNSEQIIGGYNPLFWDRSGSYKTTNNSFIFSFTNRNNLKTANAGYILDGNIAKAILCSQIYGPMFGGGHDLYRENNGTWKSSNPCSYPKIDLPKNFTMTNGYKVFNVEDYEVFQVIKK